MPCASFDRSCHLFYVQVIVSLLVLVFSMGMLITDKGDTNAYYVMLSSTLAYWLPAPKMPSKPQEIEPANGVIAPSSPRAPSNV